MYLMNRAHHENFFKAFTKIPSGTFDLCVTSPPYYNSRKYGEGWDYFKTKTDWLYFCINMLICVAEVMKPEGVIFWNTGPGYAESRRLSVVERLIVEAEEQKIYVIDKFPWCKTSALPKAYQNRPYPAWEEIILFCKEPKIATYYVDHVREPYAESTLKRLKYPVGQIQADEKGEFKKRKMVTPHPLGKSVPNYFVKKVDTSRRNHPAPMARWLANWAVRAYSKEGDLVLDPMCGIGTTLIEAVTLNRDTLGFDRNEKYVAKANDVLRLITDD